MKVKGLIAWREILKALKSISKGMSLISESALKALSLISESAMKALRAGLKWMISQIRTFISSLKAAKDRVISLILCAFKEIRLIISSFKDRLY